MASYAIVHGARQAKVPLAPSCCSNAIQDRPTIHASLRASQLPRATTTRARSVAPRKTTSVPTWTAGQLARSRRLSVTASLAEGRLQSAEASAQAAAAKAAAAAGEVEEALRSRSEEFVRSVEEGERRVVELESKVEAKQARLLSLQQRIDALYSDTFSGLSLSLPADEGQVGDGVDGSGSAEGLLRQEEQQQQQRQRRFGAMDEKQWGDLGRSEPLVLKELIAAVDRAKWAAFQRDIHDLTLQRDRGRQELSKLSEALEEAKMVSDMGFVDESEPEAEEEEAPVSMKRAEDEGGLALLKRFFAGVGSGGGRAATPQTPAKKTAEIVLVAGFESFNVDLYRKAAAVVRSKCPGVKLTVFSDRDILTRASEVEAALSRADVFFGSLVFDFDQCEWLKQRIQNIPIRLVFESSLELMATTTLGSFEMAGGKSKGMPGPVKAVLSKFGGGKEEDRMVGYLSFLKIGPKLLKFVPGKKVRDLRNWLTIYSYWNQGGLDNVANMFLFLTDAYLMPTGLDEAKPQETPPLGLYHPNHDGYFLAAADYLLWHRASRKLPADAPRVALLLYRKHVITGQKYIPKMIHMFEDAGLLPIPFFINGVEAHTVVRDLLTSDYEQEERKQGIVQTPSLKPDAVTVDAVVSTIGFPLVGGPAGSMEGGRQAEVAKSILEAKNVPYMVAGPLLIQDIASWQRSGVQGLQSVVLYSLPELDGAIDTVPLGGLVGDGIHLVPERVRRLISRIKSWVNLRRKPPSERKVAIVLYGFPPGVGAVGTAALLNVPRSLEKLLQRLHAEGYDLGPSQGKVNCDDLLLLLKELDQERAVNLGEKGPGLALMAAEKRAKEGREKEEDTSAGLSPPAFLEGAQPVAECVDWRTLRDWLGDTLTGRMEKSWGQLYRYRGIKCDAEGRSVVNGVQLGNVWIGVQPLLGLEGDPMRLLFERDLTPHPQYAAFYKWLQNGMQADAVLHFGMHGTVEWLPGSPLGNTGLSWSDVLLGNLPNIYIYAANNPSESIVAKRRGYGTIVSYNVPPYGRAGLYKELASLRELIAEFREDPSRNANLKAAIVGVLLTAGLQTDCPFYNGEAAWASGHNDSIDTAAVGRESDAVMLTEENVDAVDSADFEHYVFRLSEYLSVLENRLFSEGLHCLGSAPNPDQMVQYLSAYFSDDEESGVFPEAAVEAVATTSGDVAEVRRKLEELYQHSDVEVSRPSADKEEESKQKVEEAVAIRDLLLKNSEELESVVRGLNGDYIPAAAGGDLLRDGPGVLPTGRNIHALDPYRMPSAAAWERGSAIAANIIAQHREQNDGAYPETVGVMLWGLDAIKTRGESVAIALALVGAYPVKEGTGRVARFELRPLEDLGRPRVDVLANMSGIFRDSFANVVDLLDDLFHRAAAADEPPEMNYVRKHALELQQQGVEQSAARIFSNPAGDYGSMVNERIGAADWENGAELGDTWRSRNAFSYGRGGERGVARPEVMSKLLQTTDRIVQEIDSVEYGLTDIQEYYANTGAMKKAAETARGGAKVSCSVVETYGKDVRPRDLEATLRLEYRTKLLNPKWAEKMADQGSGGAYEISQRMTALLGWGGTADFAEDWVYDQAAQTYALDEAMAAKLRKNNPEAFRNILKRMLEAAGRGLWQASPEMIEKLQEQFAELDDELEGVNLRM